jgi:hypothetical protein
VQVVDIDITAVRQIVVVIYTDAVATIVAPRKGIASKRGELFAVETVRETGLAVEAPRGA